MRSTILFGAAGLALLTACKVHVQSFGGDGGGSAGGGTATSSGSTSTSSGTSTPTTSSSTGGPATTAALPVAPTATSFMWQGTQQAFVDANGKACKTTVAIAIGDQATCYAGPGGELRCAGKIGNHVFGPAFTPLPAAGAVEQILISPTFNAANHNSICVTRAGGTAACMGEANDHGQLGVGTTLPVPDFEPWGSVGGVRALGTGRWDSICGLTAAGALYCAGYGGSTTPTVVNPSVSTFYLDTFGMVVADVPSTFRASNGGTDCLVQAAGFVCIGPPPGLPPFGPPGHVVDGTYAFDYTPPSSPPGIARFCWLDDQGHAACAVVDSFDPMPAPQAAPVFTARPVLALAGNPYTGSLCAVYNDGSIACSGNNQEGQLGIPAVDWVGAETVVAPPGSLDLSCK